MKEVSVHPFRHGVTIHAEDAGEMRREHMNLSYREAQDLHEKLGRVLSHPSHKAIVSVPSRKSKPVIIEDNGHDKPSLRIVE